MAKEGGRKPHIRQLAKGLRPPLRLVRFPSPLVSLLCFVLPVHEKKDKDFQERKRHINIRKMLRTPARCPWDTGRTNRGLLAGVPETSCFLPTFLPGHWPGVPGTPGCPGGLQKYCEIFSDVPFLLPIKNTRMTLKGRKFTKI